MKALLALSLCLIAGCKTKPSDGATNAASGEADSDDKPSATQAASTKLNAYVHCLNDFTNDVFKGRHTWLEQFAKGPNPKQVARGSLYGPSSLDATKKCADELGAAKALTPSLPAIEKAGDAYLAAIVELQPLTVKLHDYFDQGNYKDDKLALAIELHPKLMAAYEKFMPANRALSAEVDKLEDRVSADQLAEVEKTEGKKLYWHHKRMLIDAKKLVGIAGDANTPFEIKDPAALQASVATFERDTKELLDYYKANKEELEKKSMTYWTIESSLTAFLKDSKELMRRNRDKVAFSSGEIITIDANNAESVEGHPARVIRAYNSLINDSNRLRF
ncbi:MAG: YiiG family protein [Kofleriaceae bacterium]